MDSNPFEGIMSTNPSRYRAGNKRRRPASMEVVSTPVSQTLRTITRLPRSRRQNPYRIVHRFKRTYNQGLLATSALTNTLQSFNFSMNDMPGFSELTTLYDEYRLTGVRFRLLPYLQTESNSVGTVNNVRNAPIFYAIDRTDSTTPATLDDVLEYQDHQISSMYRGIDVYIKSPKFADATNATRGGWVSTSNSTLNWFGLKVAIPPTEVAASLYIIATYYVACKSPK